MLEVVPGVEVAIASKGPWMRTDGTNLAKLLAAEGAGDPWREAEVARLVAVVAKTSTLAAR